MDLHEVGWEGMDQFDLAQDRDSRWALVNAVMNLWFLSNVESFLTSSELGSFSRRTLLHGIIVVAVVAEASRVMAVFCVISHCPYHNM